MFTPLTRVHERFKTFAARLSTPEFLQFDVWAIWIYAACLVLFCLASVFDLNGSSISIYNSIYGHGAIEKPLLGQAHWIRCDEWHYHTPGILEQSLRPDRFNVENSSLGGHSVALVSNVPVAHFTALFRPQFWPFFFLPLDYAFAAYWQFKALILITGVFTWLLLFTRSTGWAISGSLWYYLSPLTQWAYSWPSLLPEMIGSFCFALVFACYLTVGRNAVALGLAAVGMTVCAINFALCAYPPHMLPLVWLGVLFFVGWCVAAREHILAPAYLSRRLTALTLSFLVIGVTGLLTYSQARVAIHAIANTSYPGQRVFPEPSFYLPYFLSHYFGWVETEARYLPSLGNICEAAGYLWLAPFTLFCIGRLSLTTLQKITFVTLWSYFLLMLSVLLLPLPQSFVGALWLNRTGGTRALPALGLANVALVALTMSSFVGRQRTSAISRWFAPAGRLFGILLSVGVAFVLVDQIFGWFFSWKEVVISSCVLAILISLVVEGRKRALAFVLVIPSIGLFAGINPVQRGLGVITSSAMFRFVRTDKDFLRSKWIVFTDLIMMPEFLAAVGCHVYTGVHYLQDIDHFGLFASRGFDVNALNQSGYFIAHPLAPTETASLAVVSSGRLRWNVSPSDPMLKQLSIRYAAFDQKPPEAISSHLIPLSGKAVDNFWLYRIP